MTETNSKGIKYALARLTSTVLQPIAMPLYMILIILKSDSYLAVFLSPQIKTFIITTVVICTMIVPALCIFLLNAVGALEDLKMNNRRERIVPLVVVMLAYTLCAVLIMRQPATEPLVTAMVAAMACIAVALVVTPFWKISLHMTGIGGVYAVMLMLGINEPSDFTLPMIVATLLAGILAWARLYLGRHTPTQVAAGFFGGFIAASLVLLANLFYRLIEVWIPYF